jgi:hypothetical protein
MTDKTAFKSVEGRFESFMYESSKFTIKDKDGIIHSAVYGPLWADKIGYWGRVVLMERGGEGTGVWEMTEYQFMPRPDWAGPKPAYGGSGNATTPAAGGQSTFSSRPAYTPKAPNPEMIKAMAKKDRLIAIESALKSAVELGIAMKPKGTFEEVFDACVDAAIKAAKKMDAAAE